MAENRVTGKVMGLSMDGTGFGEDGRIWGGEFLIADETSFERAGHLKYLPLPGGEAAIRQPWRSGVSLLRDAYGSQWPDAASMLGIVPADYSCDQLDMVLKAGVNSPLTSSLGRVFDGVASILDLKRSVSFEGQAAVMLEAAARSREGAAFAYEIKDGSEGLILDLGPAVRAIVDGRLAGSDASGLAASFHATLVGAFVDMAARIRDRSGIDRVALSGGCFQNRVLLEGCVEGLERAGFTVYTHQRVPANDGGIALGQAVVAGYRVMSTER
jgi:hydrogenase maturation protein HypF